MYLPWGPTSSFLGSIIDKLSPFRTGMESAPWKILSSGKKEIRIDVDGGITIDGVTKHPFPISITHAVICDEGLVEWHYYRWTNHLVMD
jgi:hypothetical protein